VNECGEFSVSHSDYCLRKYVCEQVFRFLFCVSAVMFYVYLIYVLYVYIYMCVCVCVSFSRHFSNQVVSPHN